MQFSQPIPNPLNFLPPQGFGKASTKEPQIINTSSSSNKKSFVEIGNSKPKPVNDVNNPEYDDQGYTLYADEETGEKKRVFEALIDYPCEFKMKIIGANEGSFATEMVQVVADTCKVESDVVKYSERKNGKWISVTVYAPVESAEMLYTLYENIDRDPRVKFKF
jgi:putative lipoic acid-binding regulatory protein